MDYPWRFETVKPAVYQLLNSFEYRGPSCLGYDKETMSKVLITGWSKLAEVEKITCYSAAGLLCEFWNADKQWMDSWLFPGLLVLGKFAGSNELQLNSWRANRGVSSEDLLYSASRVEYVPTGWALFVIDQIHAKAEKVCAMQMSF